MYMFANPKGQVFVSKLQQNRLAIVAVTGFEAFKALISTIRVTPKPVISVLGTLGGANYLNVFGEDPVQVEITGYVVGRSCETLTDTQSAIGSSIDLYRSLGVVNNVNPISLTLLGQGQSARQAFLIAMSVTHDNAFADVAEFTMVLLGEDFNIRRFTEQFNLVSGSGAQAPATSTNNTGLPSNVPNVPSDITNSVAVPTTTLLDSSGNVLSPVVINLTDDELTPVDSNIR